MLLSCSVLFGRIFPCPPPALTRCRGDPEPRSDNLPVKSTNFAYRPVNVGCGNIVERMARRRVGQIGDPMTAVKCIDNGREAGRFAGKTREHEMAAAGADHLGKAGTGIAGRLIALEYQVGTGRFEALD